MGRLTPKEGNVFKGTYLISGRIKISSALAGVAQLFGMLSHKPKGHWFHSRLGDDGYLGREDFGSIARVGEFTYGQEGNTDPETQEKGKRKVSLDRGLGGKQVERFWMDEALILLHELEGGAVSWV